MVIVSPLLCRLFSVVVSVAGITLWPFIILAKKPDPVTLNHERIHLRQQRELLVVGFYAVYVGEWLWRLWRGRRKAAGGAVDGVEAYEGLRFEQEAYAHEVDMEYLEKRKPFAWREIPMA